MSEKTIHAIADKILERFEGAKWTICEDINDQSFDIMSESIKAVIRDAIREVIS